MRRRAGPEEVYDNGPLFPEKPALARNTDPGTSHAAAASLSEEAVGRLERQVLEALRAAGPEGLTTREIAAKTGIDWGSVTPRMPKLVKAGLVIDSGRTRLTGSNRQAIVWVAL